MADYEGLRSSLRGLINRCLDLAEAEVGERGLPARARRVAIFKGSSAMTDVLLLPDYRVAMRRVIDQVRETSEFKEFLDEVEALSAFERIFRTQTDATGSPEAYFAWVVLPDLIAVYGERNTGFSIDADLVEEFVSTSFVDMERDTVPVDIYIPIEGFASDLRGVVEIEPNLFLAPFEKEVKARWFEAGRPEVGSLIQPTTFQLLHWTHCILIRTERPWPGILNHGPTAERVQRLLTALRLMGPGRPLAWRFWSEPSEFTVLHRLVEEGALARPVPPHPSDSYEFDASSIDELRRVYEMVKSAAESRVLLALSRFDSAVDRVSKADRILDYWIALEALFLPDTRQELSFRASLRIAAALGDGPVDRQEVYKNAKTSYDVRSKIIHGKKVPAKKVDEVESNAQDLVRQSLVKALEPGGLPDVAALDDRLARGD